MSRRNLVAALVGAAVLTGCGGGSSGLAKADLAKKLDSICGSYATQIKAVPQPTDILTNSSSAATFFDKVAALYKKAEGEIDALKPADSVKSQWNDVTNNFHKLVTVIDTIKTKAENKDRSGIQMLSQIGPLTTSLNSAADAIGATGCSKS
jgi:hypothetical protein